MAYRRIVYGYYNQVRKVNHKNENPGLCTRYNILNQNYASKGKLNSYSMKLTLNEKRQSK